MEGEEDEANAVVKRDGANVLMHGGKWGDVGEGIKGNCTRLVAQLIVLEGGDDGAVSVVGSRGGEVLAVVVGDEEGGRAA